MLSHERYDCVLHLVTAALGAEQYYTKDNNSARRESLAEAIEIDNVSCFLSSQLYDYVLIYFSFFSVFKLRGAVTLTIV
jgi:hypothetical protein